MNDGREPIVRGSYLALSLLLLAIATAPLALAGEHNPAAALIAWIDIGPRVVDDGYVGGVVYPCDCTTDNGTVACPGPPATCEAFNYHSCPIVNSGGTNYCVGSGNADLCANGPTCPLTQYGTCVGKCN